jgi:hypothetical protein
MNVDSEELVHKRIQLDSRIQKNQYSEINKHLKELHIERLTRISQRKN